ncbi:uncharacterized protein LOC133895912 [Phragmites australis]|uniref:uncharacterized protein LOC133895912 n=1 Tax=Phragmites australis TaxID=29695 RepID=UPI002D79D5D3|nr:uncharacterized protein LOC133895912 [Phragmites australis]
MMARAATPARRPPSAKAAASSHPAAPALLPSGRVSLAARGVSSRPHPPAGTPSARLALPAAPRGLPAPPRKRACACSPTTHPGSFRCALHRGQGQGGRLPSSAPVSSRLSDARRPSMASPLVRIAAVEGGDHVRRALASLVRPPWQQHHRRRAAFHPRPSRLSAMSAASDDEPSP